jgi:tetrahydromethanopterin S-methyltransferase subunit G
MEASKRAHVFIKIEEYKDTMDIINLIKQKVKQSRSILYKINELNNKEDAELEEWKSSLDEVDKRIEFIDRVLLEPEQL